MTPIAIIHYTDLISAHFGYSDYFKKQGFFCCWFFGFVFVRLLGLFLFGFFFGRGVVLVHFTQADLVIL